jgi:hypothetical protein
MTAKTVVVLFTSVYVVKATNLTGCGEMSKITTFSLTVSGDDMDEQAMIDYIILRLETQDVLQVLNIVRDY